MQPQQNNLLETDLLKTFATISETGNFTVAAKRVFRTPSAVSMQIRRLEDQLGRALFVRHPRHVTLTADGEAFLVHAKDILRINDEALSRFRVPQLEGRVRFGAPDDFGVRYLPAIPSRFAATHPLVEVEVFLSTSVNLARRFEAAEIDMILTVSAQSDPRRERSFIRSPSSGSVPATAWRSRGLLSRSPCPRMDVPGGLRPWPRSTRAVAATGSPIRQRPLPASWRQSWPTWRSRRCRSAWWTNSAD